MRRVLDEALRLWPTAPAFTRSPNADTVIGDRYPMRTQDWATVLLPLIHRDPSVWGQDAEQFRPNRFLPENSRGRPPHSYEPFGTGERACIGRQFALHEAVLVLARLLHRYNVTGDSEYELAISERLTLMPEGFEVRLARRTPTASMS
jgi:cytochrome P450